MPTYTYRAKKSPTEWVEGQIEAPSRDHAVRRVSDLGYVPVKVVELQMAPAEAATQEVKQPPEEQKGPGPLKGTRSLFARVRSREITIFTRQMSTLFRSQVPILQAFSILKERSSNPKMRELIDSIYTDLKDGKALSAALQKFPKLFPPFYLALVRAGELSGRLEAILEGLTKFREKEEDFNMRVRGALAYPIFLLVAGFLTIFVLLTFVMPRLLVLFKDMEAELPLPTKILMGVSGFLSHAWPFILGAAAVIFFIYISQKGLQERLRKMSDQWKLRLPIVGKLARSTDMERFCRTLCLLIRSNIPIVKAVESAVSTLENERIQAEYSTVPEEMLRGSALSAALSKIPTFPSFVRDMVAVGEEGGRLEEILEEVANSYVSEVEEITKIMTSLIEPLLILFLGVVVGFIVAAMMLPIFQLNMAVQ